MNMCGFVRVRPDRLNGKSGRHPTRQVAKMNEKIVHMFENRLHCNEVNTKVD
jgi:hypothetical protein